MIEPITNLELRRVNEMGLASYTRLVSVQEELGYRFHEIEQKNTDGQMIKCSTEISCKKTLFPTEEESYVKFESAIPPPRSNTNTFSIYLNNLAGHIKLYAGKTGIGLQHCTHIYPAEVNAPKTTPEEPRTTALEIAIYNLMIERARPDVKIKALQATIDQLRAIITTSEIEREIIDTLLAGGFTGKPTIASDAITIPYNRETGSIYTTKSLLEEIRPEFLWALIPKVHNVC